MSEQENKPKTTPLDVDNATENKLKEILQGGLDSLTDEQDAPTDERIEFDREKTFDEPGESIDTTVFDNPAIKSIMDEIKVTDYEKEIFYESLLNDEPFSLQIEVLGDKTIEIGSRNTYEQALCYACLGDLIKEADEANEPSPDVMLWLQRFSCCFGLKKVFNKPQNPLSFEGETEKLDPHHKQALRDHAAKHFVSMKYPRWQAIVNAFMVFTAKEKLLLENVGNRDFWNPAG